MIPKHYAKQFHPKYNKSVPKNWDSVGGLWESKTDWMRNPDCPTLIGYKCKSFDNNKGVVLERNPYYWAVTKDGDQLPYIDEIIINNVQDAQVGKLQVQQGKIDFCHGPFNQIGLSDVSALSQNKARAGIEINLWDSGSGTGSMFFLNYDYPDPKLRKLFRDARFRQAISLRLRPRLGPQDALLPAGAEDHRNTRPEVAGVPGLRRARRSTTPGATPTSSVIWPRRRSCSPTSA